MYLFKLVFWGFFGYIPRSGITESYSSSIFSFSEKPPYGFPQWLHQFTFAQTVYKGSFFSTSSPIFVICVLFDNSNSNKREMISRGFDLHFGWDLEVRGQSSADEAATSSSVVTHSINT